MGGVFLDGKELTRHKAALYAAARALLDRGASPMATLRMRHRGSATVSMSDVIGELAKLTVVEDDSGQGSLSGSTVTGTSLQQNSHYLPLPIITDGRVWGAGAIASLHRIDRPTRFFWLEHSMVRR
jgi:hypothetical protein